MISTQAAAYLQLSPCTVDCALPLCCSRFNNSAIAIFPLNIMYSHSRAVIVLEVHLCSPSSSQHPVFPCGIHFCLMKRHQSCHHGVGALGGGGCSPQLGAGSLESFCSRLPVCYRCDSMRAWVRLGGFTSAPRYCQWKKEKKKQIQVTR